MAAKSAAVSPGISLSHWHANELSATATPAPECLRDTRTLPRTTRRDAPSHGKLSRRLFRSVIAANRRSAGQRGR